MRGDAGLVHTREAVAANNELAQALVDQARLSRRSFGDWNETEQQLLYRMNPVFLGQSLRLYTY